eukprot:1143131-Pelagomonas_calceolata.AAC.3
MAVRTWSLNTCTQGQAWRWRKSQFVGLHVHTGASMEEESVHRPTHAHRSKHGGGGRVSS